MYSLGGMDQQAHWLNRERIALYGRALLLAQALVLVGALAAHVFFPDSVYAAMGGNDFRVFWSAARLALQGHAADAYQIGPLFAVQQSVSPALEVAKPWQHWFYPPTFLLAVLPLALLPYLLSFLLFTSASVLFYLDVVGKIAPFPHVRLLALAFPSVLFAAANGQNSFLTAGLAGLAMLWLERRPAWAGVAIGLLAIKPHLAVLFVVALLSARCWRVLFSAALVACGFAVLSVLVLGVDTVPAFLGNLSLAKSFAEQGLMPMEKMPTAFAGARLLGASVGAANLLQLACALGAAAAVAWAWRRPAPLALRSAILLTASLLVSPHMFDYDLVWLAVALAWFGAHAMRHGWQQGERALVLLAWFSPLLCGALAKAGLPLQPLVLLLLLGALLRRVRRERRAPHAVDSAAEQAA